MDQKRKGNGLAGVLLPDRVRLQAGEPKAREPEPVVADGPATPGPGARRAVVGAPEDGAEEASVAEASAAVAAVSEAAAPQGVGDGCSSLLSAHEYDEMDAASQVSSIDSRSYRDGYS